MRQKFDRYIIYGQFRLPHKGAWSLRDITENNAEHHLRVCSKNKNNHIKSLFLVTDSIPLGVIVYSYGVKLLFIEISLYSSISERILFCRLYFSCRMIFANTITNDCFLNSDGAIDKMLLLGRVKICLIEILIFLLSYTNQGMMLFYDAWYCNHNLELFIRINIMNLNFLRYLAKNTCAPMKTVAF